MSNNSPIRLAILDDYQSIAAPYFSSIIGPDRLIIITTFTDTISPSNLPGLSALADRLEPFTIISTMRERTPFPASLLALLPNLKLLLTTGPRNAAIDLPACAHRNIIVAGTGPLRPPSGNVRHPKPDSTTTHTWTLILALARHVVRDHQSITSGEWQGPTLSMSLAGRTLGLVGLGRLGTAVGRIAVQGWGMKVLCWSPNLNAERVGAQAASAGLDSRDFEFVDKESLFRQADVVSLHMVLSERSRGMIGERELRNMKRQALFVNTSRGPLVDEEALLRVCRAGAIAGVALDVFDEEPLPRQNAWRTENWGTGGKTEVLLSPHVGYAEQGVLDGWYTQNAENVQRWLKGEDVIARL